MGMESQKYYYSFLMAYSHLSLPGAEVEVEASLKSLLNELGVRRYFSQ